MKKEVFLTESDIIKAMVQYSNGVSQVILDYDVKSEIEKFVKDGKYTKEMTMQENWSVFCQLMAMKLANKKRK